MGMISLCPSAASTHPFHGCVVLMATLQKPGSVARIGWISPTTSCTVTGAMTHLLLGVRRRLGHFVIICSLGGCTTTATITRVNGRSTDAEITGIDRENVYVKTDSGSRPIPRKEITDIDHPGDTATVIGLILGVYGVANIAVGAKYCDRKGNVYC